MQEVKQIGAPASYETLALDGRLRTVEQRSHLTRLCPDQSRITAGASSGISMCGDLEEPREGEQLHRRRSIPRHERAERFCARAQEAVVTSRFRAKLARPAPCRILFCLFLSRSLPLSVFHIIYIWSWKVPWRRICWVSSSSKPRRSRSKTRTLTASSSMVN